MYIIIMIFLIAILAVLAAVVDTIVEMKNDNDRIYRDAHRHRYDKKTEK